MVIIDLKDQKNSRAARTDPRWAGHSPDEIVRALQDELIPSAPFCAWPLPHVLYNLTYHLFPLARHLFPVVGVSSCIIRIAERRHGTATHGGADARRAACVRAPPHARRAAEGGWHHRAIRRPAGAPRVADEQQITMR